MTRPSITTRPDVVTLPDSAEAGGTFAWPDFGGRWDERHRGPFNGPTGPAMKPQWKAPIDWQNSLRTSSVVIPGAGEGDGTVSAATGFTIGQSVATGLTTAMLVAGASLIAAFWHLASDEHDRDFLDVVRLVRSRVPALVATLIREASIVFALGATIVGIPWAIRQAIRHQFAVPVVVTANLSGTSALRRSSELVRGRWWQTALTVILFAGLAAVITGAVELLLLIVLSGVPRWVYPMASFAAVGLVIPLVATPAILLYGDAAVASVDRPPT